jgi:hypothetical protein
MSARKVAFWLLFATTAVVYVYVAGWSLDIIEMEAGGAEPFDLRTNGYAFEANTFLRSLSPAGYAQYLDIQQALDLVFLLLYATTLLFGIRGLMPPHWGERARMLFPLVAVVPTVCDFMENGAVAVLLRAGADHITPEAVATASRWTTLKSETGFAVLFFLLVLLVIKAATTFRARARPGPA